ncbi:FAD-binding oxidoreductase [Tellurirhabdus bombi]|uniref:FAD-binding oxidoreductase n=1 Tax=Tellurirhabdus bombi TaxID=2907205 RepID=UPI001F206D46|nr:FAD-binding oxidoreductase [Tellurirhabdus bombi]
MSHSLLFWLTTVCFFLHLEIQAKPIDPSTYKKRQLIVGSGGGFTGRSETYYLFEDGQLFKKSSVDTAFTRLPKQSAKVARHWLKKLETTCRIKETKFKEPGNTYEFVRWKKGAEVYTVTWGNDRIPPEGYQQLHEALMKRINPN